MRPGTFIHIVLSVFNSCSKHILQRHGDALRRARDGILGSVNLRGPAPPVNGVGGTEFERSGYADPVEKGARAYGVLTSEQKRRARIVGPARAYKVRCIVSRRNVHSFTFPQICEEDRSKTGPRLRVEALQVSGTLNVEV